MRSPHHQNRGAAKNVIMYSATAYEGRWNDLTVRNTPSAIQSRSMLFTGRSLISERAHGAAHSLQSQLQAQPVTRRREPRHTIARWRRTDTDHRRSRGHQDRWSQATLRKADGRPTRLWDRAF